MIDWSLILHVVAGVVLGAMVCVVLAVSVAILARVARVLLDARHPVIRVSRHDRS
ncbi:hypothetical protein PQS31_00085 [Luteimonas sp BLCC-B24]|uniref:hypothetical protein n=1 Tax=Luteimonas sp. BLCC-B24 TaxID=3025317 RepID=UPI00234DE5B6|nr:hypothetical protein [Luteimonas sp. BLCC-B24]MDC7805229.1 hypothetical protein [Luteimonas sp. BLCC-B24]